MILRTSLIRCLAGLTALLFVLALPFGATYAASGSSTNAGKLARSAQAKRRAGGRVVRRKKARVTSKRGSKKRAATKKRARKKVARRSTKKRIRRTLRVRKSSKKASRRLGRSKKRVAQAKRRIRAVRPTKPMAKVARGPVEPKLVKAAYNAMESGKLKTKVQFDCIPDELKAVLGQVAVRFGTVTVNSSHRTRAHNRRVGGKSRSFHLKCQAADFNVAGSHRGIVAFLRKHPMVGGYKRYPAGHFHIDVGPKRTW